MIVKDALAAFAVATARVFEDRTQTVGASEVGQCARKTFWIKMEGDALYGAPRAAPQTPRSLPGPSASR